MGIFDNAESVVINGHEVQSIIDSNGGVLYEKQSGDNYLLTLTSDKDILSYYDNDSALLTATLTNNGIGVQSEIVRFDGFLLDTPITRSITQNTETHVGNKYILSNIPITNLNKIFLNKEHTVYVTKDAVDGVMIHWPNGGSGDESSNISVENGIITYSRGGTTYTEDCSSYDMSVIYPQVNGLAIQDYGVFGTTDSNGQATATYNSHGVGDVTITVECEGVTSSPVAIEDCIYADITQRNITRSGSITYGYINSARLSNLPSTYSIEFDMKTSTAPASGNEHRLYWCPTSQWENTSSYVRQPANALVIGYCYRSSGGAFIEYGKRLSSTTSSTTNIVASLDTWNSVKISKVNTSGRCDFYIDGTYRDYYTFTNMDSYTEWGLPYILWSNTTFSIRNLKIKPNLT